jgi:hypothetical protein
MWSAPLSALIIAYFLYHAAGYAGIIGIIAVFIVVPVQGIFTTTTLHIQIIHYLMIMHFDLFAPYPHYKINWRNIFLIALVVISKLI